MRKLPHFDRIKVITEAKSSTIILTGYVNEKLTSELQHALAILPLKKLTLVVNSEGGDIDQGFAMYDLIRTYPKKTTAVATGNVMSAAVLPFLACDERLTFESTAFMIHHGFSGAAGHHKEVVEIIKEFDRLDDLYLELIVERTGLTLSKVRKYARFTKYMTAHEAAANGFVDGIIVPRERTKKVRRKKRRASRRKS